MREKTVTISFRISEKALKALQEDARKHNTSLNTLANQLFTTYSEYDRYLQKFNMIKISNPTFKRILNAATKEEIVEAGRTAGASVPASFVLAKMGEITPTNAVEYIALMGTYANLFDYSSTTAAGRTVITLTHDLGPNGSVFLASYMESIFKETGRNVRITQYADGVTIEV